jgi:hypothetical protein
MVEKSGVQLPIDYAHAEEIISRYANNIVIQHTKHEFIISFFETLPPILIGEPNNIKSKLEKLGRVRANCVARIVVSVENMPDFVNAIQENLKKYQSKMEDAE